MPAATSQEYPTINGYAPSWADIQVTIDAVGGETVKDIDFAGFKVASKLTVGKQKGASGGRVIRRTSGDKEDTASATYYRSGLRTLIKALIPMAPTRGNQVLIGLVAFTIQIQHTPPGETEIHEIVLKGCRLVGFDFTMAEGPDADKVELELDPIENALLIDGKEVVLA